MVSILVPEHLDIKKSGNKGMGIFAKKPINAGEIILSLAQNISLLSNVESSISSIQIDDDVYIEPKLPQIWQFCNHDCEPNAMLNTEKFQMIAIKNITQGEEITYHYCTTEFDLLSKNEHFQCFCGSKYCIGTVSGFKHITQELKIKLKPHLATYLRKKLAA